MNYLVLARKWRPQTFDDVTGQDHVVKTLKNSIRFNRIAHAVIFSGPRGVGKTSVARILAKALNCAEGPTQTPCNKCTNCKEITEGISMDVREIDGASNRGIDEIRDLRENVKFSSVMSPYKLYVIDEVHMLTREAFNALLKTLEEPPSHVVFVFATTDMHKIPATILSRCQCYEFRRVSVGQIRDNLRAIASAEGINISDMALTWIAEAGDGSLRDAQSIFDQAISYAGTNIENKDVEEMLSLADRHFLFRLSAAVFERKAGECLKIIEDAYYAGVDMKHFYLILIGHFRNLLLTKIANQDSLLLEMGDDEIAALKSQADGVTRETLQCLLDILMAGEEAMIKSQFPRITLEAVIVRMAYIEPLLPIDHILERMEGIEKRLISQASLNTGASNRSREGDYNPSQKNRSSTSTDKPYEILQSAEANKIFEVNNPAEGEADEVIWENYKAFIKNQSSPLWSKIEQGKFIGYDGKCLRIGFGRKAYVFFEDNNDKAKLKEIAKMFFGKDVLIEIESLDVDPVNKSYSNNDGEVNNNGMNDSKREALRHPILQKVLDVFEGAVVKEVIKHGNHK